MMWYTKDEMALANRSNIARRALVVGRVIEDCLELRKSNAIMRDEIAYQRKACVLQITNAHELATLREAAAAVVEAWPHYGLEQAIEDFRIAAGIKAPPIDAADGDRADEAHANLGEGR